MTKSYDATTATKAMMIAKRNELATELNLPTRKTFPNKMAVLENTAELVKMKMDKKIAEEERLTLLKEIEEKRIANGGAKRFDPKKALPSRLTNETVEKKDVVSEKTTDTEKKSKQKGEAKMNDKEAKKLKKQEKKEAKKLAKKAKKEAKKLAKLADAKPVEKEEKKVSAKPARTKGEYFFPREGTQGALIDTELKNGERDPLKIAKATGLPVTRVRRRISALQTRNNCPYFAKKK